MKIFKNFLWVLTLSILIIQTCFAKDIRFAQVTDVKFTSENNTILKNVVNDINKQHDIEFVIFTGDNIAKPSKENLADFLSIVKKLKSPFYLVIGDKEVNKRKQLSKKEYAKFVHKKVRKYKPKTPNYIFEKQGMVFMVTDGAKDVIPSTIGYYRDEVLEWMDANLDLYNNKNVIIFQHFPVIPPAEKESYYTYKADKYLDIISKHNNVKAIISGHFGINKEQDINGVKHISTAPAPEYRIIDIIDCDTEQPTIWAQVKKAE